MKYTKQILALFMAVILLTAAVGCDEGTPVNTTTFATTTTVATTTVTTQPKPQPEPEPEPEYPPDPNRFLEKIPDDLNFASMGWSEEELTVQIAYVEGANGEYTRRSLQADFLDNTPVDRATVDRNGKLEDQLGLQVAISPIFSIAGMEQELGSSLLAGTCEYDILAGYQYFGIGMASKGFLLNLADLTEYDADYIDLQATYWGNAYNEAMSYKGAYCWITGDLALRYTGGAYCTFVNTDLYDEYLSTDYGSIYEIVKKGDWTMDLLTEMATKCYVDNGSIVDKADAGDTFGFGYEPNDMMDGLVIGAGVPFAKKDSKTKELSLVFGDTKTNYKAYTVKLEALTDELSSSYQYADGEAANVMSAFGNGNVMFTVSKLYHAKEYLKDMDSFSVIPVPKFDTTQKNYRTGVHDGCTIFGITHCSSRVAQAAATLEFLAANSSKDVLTKFYDELLDSRYTGDTDQAEMVNMIHDSITTDFAVAWGKSLNDLIYNFRDHKTGLDNTIVRNRDEWAEDLAELTNHLGVYAESQH